MNNNTTLIYPVTLNNGFIVNNFIRNLKSSQYILATFSGSGLNGKTFKDAYNREFNNSCIIKNYNADMIKKTKRIILLDCGEYYLKNEVYNEFISLAKTLGKDIAIDYFHPNNMNNEVTKQFNVFKSIDVPVVGIASLFPSQDSINIIYHLTQILENKGYSVMSYSADSNSQLINIKNYPIDIFNNLYRSDELILKLNNMINIDIKDNLPDIIFLDLPDGIVKVNDLLLNNFGVFSNIIHNAIPHDYLLYFLPLNYHDQAIIENYSSDIKNILGNKPNQILQSNIIVEMINGFSLKNDLPKVYDYYKYNQIIYEKEQIIVKGEYSLYLKEIIHDILNCFGGCEE